MLLKHYLIPKMLHTMVLSASKRKDLVAADFKIRCAVRQWLHLPTDTPLAYIYARVKDGGLGVMELRAMIPVLKRKRLEELRTSNHPYREKLVDSKRWMQILQRCRPSKEEGITMDSKAKVKEVTRTQLYQKVDGAGLQHAGEVPSAHKWVDDGTNLMSGGAYVAAVKIRGNLMTTAHRSTRGRSGDRLCDAGCRRAETFAHISQVCPRTWAPRGERHDRVVNYVCGRLKENGWAVEKEQVIPTSGGKTKKPDIVARRGADVLVTDVTITADNAHPDEAHHHKVTYYDQEDIREHLRGGRSSYNPAPRFRFSGVALSWRGIWSRASAEDLEWAGLGQRDFKIISVRTLEGGKKIAAWFRKSTEGVVHRGGRLMTGRP